MDSEKDFPVTKRKHFAKLHQRIQNKYNEMQKKLQKSKSVDCLTSIEEDNVTKENVSSVSDLNLSADEVFVQENGRHSHPVMHTVIIEDVSKPVVNYADIGYKEASVSESEWSVTNSADVFDYANNLDYKWSISSESLNDFEKKSDENSLPSTPKLSIKNKIGSRISAARERRREEKEKERNNKKEELERATKVEKFIFSNTTKPDLRLNRDKKRKLATLTIALIEATGLETDTEEKLRHFQCRFKLGFDKWKSKTVKNVSTHSTVQWKEVFSMSVYDEFNTPLEVILTDDNRKDTFVGRNIISLSEMEKEKTHVVRAVLEGIMPNAEIFFLLTITGTPFDDLLIDMDNYLESQSKIHEERGEFAFYHLGDMHTVGRLSVIVYGAKGLAGLDTYCSLRLINEVRQTHTECRTNDPNWMKCFSFNVTDITSMLEVMVYDDKKEEVGRIIIPLLEIIDGTKIWYALKDSTLRERARGNNPRILLEMRISWNIIKASIRVIKPKEYNLLDTEEKIDRKVFLKNVARAKIIVMWMLDFMRLLKSCFEWESRKMNTIGLIGWLLFNWYFQVWMLPLLLIVPFCWYRPERYYLINWPYYVGRHCRQPTHKEQEKEEKFTFRQKINNIQGLVQSVQSFIGQAASFGESIKNLFNFSVPFLSFLSIFFLLAIAVVLYFIPLQYLLMGWGIKKYVRKIIWPNRVANSEVLDLLSRVPDDELLADCDYLQLENNEQLRHEEEQVHH